MIKKTKGFAKGGIATAAVGALALAGATPAYAGHRDRDGISTGEIIAGAVILGGVAAVASAASSNRYRDYDDRNRYRDNYRYGGTPRSAVERCVAAVERDARSNGYRYADVTQIHDVDSSRHGWRVSGRLQVAGGGYDRYDRYDRDDRYDSHDRYDNRYRRGDDGRFTCYIERGRVAGIDYDGIRRL